MPWRYLHPQQEDIRQRSLEKSCELCIDTSKDGWKEEYKRLTSFTQSAEISQFVSKFMHKYTSRQDKNSWKCQTLLISLAYLTVDSEDNKTTRQHTSHAVTIHRTFHMKEIKNQRNWLQQSRCILYTCSHGWLEVVLGVNVYMKFSPRQLLILVAAWRQNFLNTSKFKDPIFHSDSYRTLHITTSLTRDGMRRNESDHHLNKTDIILLTSLSLL